jgi:putative acetyltransferase
VGLAGTEIVVMDIRVELLASLTADARQLIAELDQVLGAVYEPEQQHGLSIEQVFEPNVRFFIARIGGAAVGCGAAAVFDGYAEVKRMYTREAARGQGVGKALLARIEVAARDAERTVLRLETGTYQAAAIGLYEGYGFRSCGPFGHYAELPPHRIAASLFYEKPLYSVALPHRRGWGRRSALPI